MIMLIRNKKLAGFTLIELVIVLAVASLLFAGLWRLLSGANQQNRLNSDQQTITNMIQSFHRGLGSAQGKTFLTNLYNKYGAGTNIQISLPTAGFNSSLANCQAAGNTNFDDVTPLGVAAAAPQPLFFMCLFLDRGLDVNTVTSFNQNFRIVIQNPADDDGNAATIPSYVGSQYTLIVGTTGGDRIPDTSGGQLASMIGGSGGFIYNDTDVCTATTGASRTNSACGAYGSWAVSTTDFGINGDGGHVFTRSTPPSQSQNDIWLARKPFVSGINVGTGNTEDFNTLQTDTHMNGNASFNMQGSPLNLQGGTIFGNQSPDLATRRGNLFGLHQLQFGDDSDVDPTDELTAAQLVVNGPNADGTTITVPKIGGGTKTVDFGPRCGTIVPTAGLPQGSSSTCAFIAEFKGNVSVTGMLYAKNLYAESFVYETSDIRLKRDIREIDSPLEKLNKLRAVSFIKNSDELRTYGLIAQDVEQVFPELVKDVGEGYKGIEYYGMIGPLVGAIKELKRENDTLRQELNKQSAELKKLQRSVTR